MKLDRKLLTVAGADRIKFLNDLLTIEVKANMALRYGALLTPQGKILTDLFLRDDGAQAWLDLPAAQYDAIKARLTMYKLRAEITFADSDLIVGQSCEGDPDPRSVALGARVYGEEGDMSAGAYVLRRIEAKIAEFGVDFAENEAYPIEWRFDQMNAIDHQKGCYVGQEIAARMRHKSELKKSLFRANYDGNAEIGADVLVNDKPVGTLLSHQDGRALLFLRMKAVDQELSVEGQRLSLD